MREEFAKSKTIEAAESEIYTDMTNLPLSVIRHLVSLHEGTFAMSGENHKGSTFTITLPCLNKQEVELLTSSDTLDSIRPINPTTTAGGNVISFPKGKKT
jgi:hypothetical protein